MVPEGSDRPPDSGSPERAVPCLAVLCLLCLTVLCLTVSRCGSLCCAASVCCASLCCVCFRYTFWSHNVTTFVGKSGIKGNSSVGVSGNRTQVRWVESTLCRFCQPVVSPFILRCVMCAVGYLLSALSSQLSAFCFLLAAV